MIYLIVLLSLIILVVITFILICIDIKRIDTTIFIKDDKIIGSFKNVIKYEIIELDEWNVLSRRAMLYMNDGNCIVLYIPNGIEIK